MTFKKHSINSIISIISFQKFKINQQKYFSKKDEILNSKRHNLGFLKQSLLERDALIKLGLFRFKNCPKK